MADISQVTIPDGNAYNLKDARIAYCTCNTAAGTAAKVATPQSGEFRLAVGTIIGVKFTNTNTASNPTINVDGTGAKHIWYNNAAYTGKDSGITGYANRISYYMYDGTYWVHLSNGIINSNTYDRTYLSNTGYKAGSSAIVAANIIVAGADGLYHHLKSGAAFDITMPILYASSACNANATNNGGYVIIPFTVTTTQSITLTANLPVYIKGQLSGTTFTPVSTTPLTQTEPTTADGYEYMLLGKANTTTVMYLLSEHPIFAYRNGKFGSVVNDADSVNGHTVDTNVPSDAVFTDTIYRGLDGNPVTVDNADYQIYHVASGVTAASKGDTSNQTPGFGSTFKVTSGTVNVTGHMTAFADHTVTIPNTVASTSAAGLMSTTHVTTLNDVSTVTTGTLSWSSGFSKTDYGSNIRRVGKVGFLYLNFTTNVTYSSPTQFATLPSGFRPAYEVAHNFHANGGTENSYISITTAGAVKLGGYTGSKSKGIRQIISFPLA